MTWSSQANSLVLPIYCNRLPVTVRFLYISYVAEQEEQTDGQKQLLGKYGW